MACLLDSSYPPSSCRSILTELIATSQDMLGYQSGEGVQLYATPSSDKGAVILMPKNRKLLEEKFMNLRALQDNCSDCKVFNLCERHRDELIKTLNQKLSHKYIHHFDLLYNKKVCGLVTHLHTNEAVTSCVTQLTRLKHDQIFTEPDRVLINLGAIEQVVSGEEMGTYMSHNLDAYRDRFFCLAVRNLLKLTGKPVVYVDSCESRLDMEGVREEAGRICKRCEELGLLVDGEESQMIFPELHSQLSGAANHRTQHTLYIPLRKCGGRFSNELILSSFILLILKTNKLLDRDRIVLYVSGKLEEMLLRALHILYTLECIHSSLETVLHSTHKVTHSDLTAVLESRRECLKDTLVGREYSGGDTSIEERATLLCDCTIKLEVLSQPANHTIKLVSTDKIGTHYSMFVLYNYARITQILNKFRQLSSSGVYGNLPQLSDTDFNLLQLPNEWNILVKYILSFQDLLTQCFNTLQPKSISNICKFLVSLSQDFSNYYSKTKILTQSGPHLHAKLFARIHFISSLKRVMDTCFLILEITPPDQL